MNQNSSDLLEQAKMAVSDGRREEALALYATVLKQIPAETADAGLKEQRLTAVREQGGLQWLLGYPQDALKSYEQYYLEAGTSHHAVEALIMLGRQYTRMKEEHRALETHQEALDLAKALNYTVGRAKAVRGIGSSLRNLGRTEEALPYLKQALALFEQLEDWPEQMYCWNFIGITQARLGALDKAIAAFQSCLHFARRYGDRETAITLNNLGECHQNLYDMDQALAYHREGLALVEAVGLQFNQADLARNTGVDLRHLGRIEESREFLNRALADSRASGNADVELQTLYSLALTEIQHGDAELALDYAQKFYERAQQSDTRGYQADALYVLGLYDRRQGENIAAQQKWQEALFLGQETGRQMLLWQLHSALAEVADTAGLTVVHNRIAAEIIHQIAYPIEDEALKNSFLTAAPIKKILDAVEAAGS